MQRRDAISTFLQRGLNHLCLNCQKQTLTHFFSSFPWWYTYKTPFNTVHYDTLNDKKQSKMDPKLYT